MFKKIFCLILFIALTTSSKETIMKYNGQKHPLGSDSLSNECATFFATQIRTELFDKVDNMLDDFEKKTGFFGFGRIKRAFEAVGEETIQSIFNDDFTPQDLFQLTESLKRGNIKGLSRDFENFIHDLYHIVSDWEPVFWTKDNTSFFILKKLKEIDASQGYVEGDNTANVFTLKALNETQKIIIARALGEHSGEKYKNSTILKTLFRWYSPHYDRVLRFIEFADATRERGQVIDLMDQPVYAALEKFKGKLSKKRQRKLEALIADTPGMLEDLRKDIEAALGIEISESKQIDIQTLDLRILDKIIKKSPAAKKLIKLYKAVDRHLDEVDAAGHEVYGKPMPVQAKEDVHLQLRFPQYTSETEKFQNHYLKLTGRSPKDSSYGITLDWDVTETYTVMEPTIVTHTDAKGKTSTSVEMRPVTKYAHWTVDKDYTAQASFEEILNQKISPNVNSFPEPHVSSRHGGSVDVHSPSLAWMDKEKTKLISDRAKDAIASEKPFRKKLRAAINYLKKITPETYDSILSTPSKYEETLRELEVLKQSLITQLQEIEKYKRLSKKEIIAQWAYDIPKNFRKRNNALEYRIEHIIIRIDHLQEQIRRHIPLDPPLVHPDSSEAEKILKQKKNKTRAIQIGSASVIGIGTGTYFYFQDEVNDKMEDTWDHIKENPSVQQTTETLYKKAKRIEALFGDFFKKGKYSSN